MPIFAAALMCVAVCGVRGSSLADSLPAKPTGIGHPASDRVWWEKLGGSPGAVGAIKAAERWLMIPMPAFDAQRYLDYTTNGDRTRYQTINSKRWDRFARLVIGECLEGKRRFIPAIDETVRSLCADPSWILPAHDQDAAVFKGASPYADLVVAMNGYQMALAAWLLEHSLPPETTAMMRENVSKRLTGPVLATIDGTAPKNVIAGHWWARCNHNWNSVCTAGALGAILATEPSREIRAKAVDWALKNNEAFLTGFGKDGYCSEGIGYWNYGFGHFTVMAETIRSQSGGTVDLFRQTVVRTIAEAPSLLEMTDGVYPAFADCGLNTRPDASLVELIGWRLDGQAFTGQPSDGLSGPGTIYHIMTHLAARLDANSETTGVDAGLPLRSWFPESGVCVVRANRPGSLAAAWKGGHNAEHHNHNDVGTTVVAWKGRTVIVDPGAMVYRAETFSKNRYHLPVMGSYGHSVPVIAGTLQNPGAASRGVLISNSFTEASDRVVMDLASAYPGTDLKKLERHWTYHRLGEGSLVIEDQFGFGKASDFSTALVALGEWYLIKGGKLSASFLADGGGDAILRVDVEFSNEGNWDVHKIVNPGKPSTYRLGLGLSGPAISGQIRMSISPGGARALSAGTKLAALPIPEKLADARKAPATISH
jgi:hypothetical protein